jgi:hypothetical protein
MRWIVADAYAHLGELDSASAFVSEAIGSTRIPPGHVVLRGLAYPYGRRRIAQWQADRGRVAAARAEWNAVVAVVTSPDRALRPMLVDPTRRRH